MRLTWIVLFLAELLHGDAARMTLGPARMEVDKPNVSIAPKKGVAMKAVGAVTSAVTKKAPAASATHWAEEILKQYAPKIKSVEFVGDLVLVKGATHAKKAFATKEKDKFVGIAANVYPHLPPYLVQHAALPFHLGPPPSMTDSDLTLDQYIYFSSHNSAFSGPQLGAKCTADAVSSCMKMGARVIELDVFAHMDTLTGKAVTIKDLKTKFAWNEATGPPVHHGPKSMTEPLGFRSACETIMDTYQAMIKQSLEAGGQLPPPLIVTLDGDYSEVLDEQDGNAKRLDSIMTYIVLDVLALAFSASPWHAKFNTTWGGYETRPKFALPALSKDDGGRLMTWAMGKEKTTDKGNMKLPEMITNRLTLNAARGTIILRDKTENSMIKSISLFKNSKQLKHDYKHGLDDKVISEVENEKSTEGSHHPDIFWSISVNQNDLNAHIVKAKGAPNPTDHGLMVRTYPTLGVKKALGGNSSSNFALSLYLHFMDSGIQIPASNMQRNGEVLWFFQWLFLLHSSRNDYDVAGAFPRTWWPMVNDERSLQVFDIAVAITWSDDIKYVGIKYHSKDIVQKKYGKYVLPPGLDQHEFDTTTGNFLALRIRKAQMSGLLFVVLKTKQPFQGHSRFHCVIPTYMLNFKDDVASGRLPMLAQHNGFWLKPQFEPMLVVKKWSEPIG